MMRATRTDVCALGADKVHRHSRWCGPLAVLLLAGFAQSAQSGILLSEDFDDNAAPMTKIVAGDATLNSINIRLGGNVINTSGNEGFDNFFDPRPNRFLVIGDNTGDLSGEPNGQTIGAFSAARFNLGGFGAGDHSLGVRFDFAFDTNRAPGRNGQLRSPDDFFVALLDDTDNLIHELMRFDDVLRNEPSRKGTYDQWVDFSMATPGGLHLVFAVFENNGTLSSAAGIDNLQVVSEPASLALLGLGLAGLGTARARRT